MSKESKKLGKLTEEDKIALRSRVATHPDVTSHFRKGSDLYALKGAKLLKLAETLGLDIASITSGKKSDHELSRHRKPAFSGSFEFEIEFHLLNKVVKRMARINYTHTPDWDRRGHRCGGRSAYSRAGGRSVICYPRDVTPGMVAEYQQARN